jgi:hypothetical protein
MSSLEERAVPVIARPVGVHRERDDRNIDSFGIDRQQDAAVVVNKFQMICGNPAAFTGPADVAPIVV